MPFSWETLKKRLEKSVIVSVQASEGEPLNRSEIIEALALSVLSGGASALRMANTDNDDPIGYFKSRHPDIPVFGLTKPIKIPANAHELVYITPGKKDIDQLIQAKADIIAMDATLRPRPDGEALQELVNYCREKSPETFLMADVATVEEGLNAAELGFDMISTTLSGYTTATRERNNGKPDFEILKSLCQQVKCPVIMEGRVWLPEEVTQGFELGAFAVIIGSAITRPHHITQRFCAAIPSFI